MNMHPLNRSTHAAVALLALSAAVSTGAIGQTRCDSPQGVVDRQACQKAKEGPAALRRFIERTQAVYMLHFWDYMTEADIDKYYAAQQPAAAKPVARAELTRAEAAEKQ